MSIASSTHVGIGVWLIQNGKVLLGQRMNAHGEGSWAPPGGHLEFGETPIEGAYRELKEETNLTSLSALEGPWTYEFFPLKNRQYISTHIFITEFSGELKLMEPNKCKEWRWFKLDELPKNLFLSVQALLAKGSLREHLDQASKLVVLRKA